MQGFQRSRDFEAFRFHSCEGAEMEACGLRSCDARSIPRASGPVRAAEFANFSMCLNILQVAAFYALG